VALNHQAKMESSGSSEAKPMAVRQPRYSKEEFAQRGDALYESQIRQQVEEGNHGKIVVICLGATLRERYRNRSI
jgi:deoxyxylulose-5-phosphate synthase